MGNNQNQFKPYDRVIARYEDTDKWICDLYSHRDKEVLHLHVLVSGRIIEEHNILPYEGNEHLVGTSYSPDEEVQLEEDELIIVFDDRERLLDNSCVRKFRGVLNSVFETNAAYWNYAIRFSDFNPDDMEETKKHILCVKDGKIVRYKC